MNSNTARSFLSEDYYYTDSSLGIRLYYFTATSKIAGVSHLSAATIHLIQTKADYSLKSRSQALRKQRQTLLERSYSIILKLQEIDAELSNMNESDLLNRKRSATDFFRKDAYRAAFQEAPPEPERKRRRTEGAPTSFLLQLNIRCRKDWRSWLLKNHPDKIKGRDPSAAEKDLCSKVLESGKCF